MKARVERVGWTIVAGALLALAAAAPPPAAADKIVQWKDEQGRVHFSNIGPSGDAKQAEETAPAETNAPLVLPPAASGDAATGEKEKSRFADLSDDTFSSEMSRQRGRLRRELRDAKGRVEEIDQKLATVHREKNALADQVRATLQGVIDPKDVDSGEEKALKEEKVKTEKRISEIRKQYDDLHEDAVKRTGGQPSWWLPLD